MLSVARSAAWQRRQKKVLQIKKNSPFPHAPPLQAQPVGRTQRLSPPPRHAATMRKHSRRRATQFAGARPRSGPTAGRGRRRPAGIAPLRRERSPERRETRPSHRASACRRRHLRAWAPPLPRHSHGAHAWLPHISRDSPTGPRSNPRNARVCDALQESFQSFCFLRRAIGSLVRYRAHSLPLDKIPSPPRYRAQYCVATSKSLQKRVRGTDRSRTVLSNHRTYADGRRRSLYSRRHRHVSVV